MSYTLRGTLTAADAASNDNYGVASALSADGSVLVVGASLRNVATDQGGVYIYDWSGSAWVQRGSVLLAADGAASELFGASVALNSDGTILAVGAKQRTYASRYGGVYIYDWSGSAWVQRGSVLVPSFSGQYFPYFGSSVALNYAGTTLAVGAEQWDGGIENSGGAFVYDWSGSAWVQRGSLITDSEQIRMGSGVSLNADGSTIVVGAYYYYATWAAQGCLLTYDWSGSAWIQRGYALTASDAGSNDWFGWSCAISGNGEILIVGSPQQETTGTNRGVVYVFSRNVSAWTQQAIISASDAADSDLFGSASISSNGLVIAIGAPSWEGSQTNQGSIYIYDAEAIAAQSIISVQSPIGAARLLAGMAKNDVLMLLQSPLCNPVISAFVANRAPHLYSITAYISGGEDGTTDYPISLTSFGLSKRSGAASYYSISAQFTQDLLDAITARPNGLMHIWRDGRPWESFNVGHPIQFDIGPSSASISINGTRQVTLTSPASLAIEPRHVIASGINSSGLLTLDLVPGFFDPRPGDSITWDGGSYTVDLKKYNAGSGGQTLSINAVAV